MSTYLTYDKRLEIQKGLKNQLSFGEIAKTIDKDRTTVAKEIKRYAYEQKTGYSSYPYNACLHRKTCTKKNICPLGCNKTSRYKCSICSLCNDICDDFQEEVCSHRNKPPYACNGCEQLDKCSLKKYIYDAEDAHLLCQSHLSESRTGILCNEFELARINALVTPLIKNGQSIHHIYESNRDELMCSENPVILTDNGSEFSNPKAIEAGPDCDDIRRTNVFYCDPSSPYQKGAIEVNHELIRRIVPKGKSFDRYNQEDIFLMMDHINSYKRKKLNNRSPYDAFSFYYGEDILKRLGCKLVAAENIILKPHLLKK